MKRLLLGPAVIAIPLALFGCSNWGTVKTPELPKVPTEVVRQIPLEDFEHFPSIPMPQRAPEAPAATKEKPRARVGAHHRPAVHATVRPLPRPRPHVDQAPVETLPPQQGPICIFPLNMIPNCTPQEIR